ncbi:MAG: hypothetical protein R2880_16715 [Deinococcales bacterium]
MGKIALHYWASQNSDCSICIRVCPSDKDYRKWWHRLGIKLAATPLRSLMLWLDERLGFGKRLKPANWWNKG